MRIVLCVSVLTIAAGGVCAQPAKVIRKPVAEFAAEKSDKPDNAFVGADISPDGKFVACVRKNEKVTVFAVEGARPLFTTEPIAAGAWLLRAKAVFSADGQFIAVPTDDAGQLAILSARTGKTLTTLKADRGMIDTVAFSPDGKKVAVSSGFLYHKWVDVFDTTTGKLLGEPLKDVDGAAQQLLFSSDGKHLFAAFDFRVHGMDMVAYKLTSEVRGGPGLNIFFQGDKLYAVMNNMEIYEISKRGFEMSIGRFGGFGAVPSEVVMSVAGNPAVAAVVKKKEVVIRNMEGKDLYRVTGEDSLIDTIRLSADARVLLILRQSRRVEVFRLE